MKMRMRATLVIGLIIAIAGARWGQGRYLAAQVAAPLAQEGAQAKPFVNAHAIIIVRHADIDITLKRSMGARVPLLARGDERAKELAGVLKDFNVTRIITSATVRGQATAAPLSALMHVKTEVPDVQVKSMLAATEAEVVADQAEAWFNELASTAKAGDTILLVHHHTVIPVLLGYFGVKEPPIDEAREWDRMYVILPDAEKKTYQVVRLRYGKGNDER